MVTNNTLFSQVWSYKHLGVHTDISLDWNVRGDNLSAVLQQRMYFLRRPRAQKLMSLFIFTVSDSRVSSAAVLRPGAVTWQCSWGHWFPRLVQTSTKIIEAKNHPSLWKFREQSVIRQARKITSDLSHIPHSELQLSASGRRHRVPESRVNGYKYLCPSPLGSSAPTHSRRGDHLVQYRYATFLL